MSENKLDRAKIKWERFQLWRALHPDRATGIDLLLGFVVGVATGWFWL